MERVGILDLLREGRRGEGKAMRPKVQMGKKTSLAKMTAFYREEPLEEGWPRPWAGEGLGQGTRHANQEDPENKQRLGDARRAGGRVAMQIMTYLSRAFHLSTLLC